MFRVNEPCSLPDSPTSGLTQFGRAMKELDIELICAHSAQAKGRVERANQTVHDRLVKELRVRAISTVVEANAYLPEFAANFNTRFAVTPRVPEDAHRPLSPLEDLSRILRLVERRVLSKNLTISYHSHHYQIETKRASYTMRGACCRSQRSKRWHALGRVSRQAAGGALIQRTSSGSPRRSRLPSCSTRRLIKVLSRPSRRVNLTTRRQRTRGDLISCPDLHRRPSPTGDISTLGK